MSIVGGYEPGLSSDYAQPTSGHEPMLGGTRRYRIARQTLLSLIDLDNINARESAIVEVLAEGTEQLYCDGLTAVLRPDARYHQPGRLWKVPFSYEQKLAAMDSLLKLVPERALGGFVIAVGNDDGDLQRAAIWLISEIEDNDAERALLTILEDRRAEIRHPAMQALARRWGESNGARLVHPHGSVVAQAASWLGQFGDLRTQHLLVAALRDRALGTVDDEEAASAIVSAIARIANRGGDEHLRRAIQICRAVMWGKGRDDAVYRVASAMLAELTA